MFRLAKFSLANRVLVALITIVIAGFGVFSVTELKQELIPSIEMPQVSVMTQSPGSTPEVVDERISEPLSKAVEGIDGVEEVVATSSSGLSTVSISYAYGTDADDFKSDVQSAIDKLTQLPDGAEPELASGSTSDMPILYMTASSKKHDAEELSTTLSDGVVPKLESVDGVDGVDVSGDVTERIEITPDEDELAKHGLSPQSINDALEANGMTLPLGEVDSDGGAVPVQGGKALDSLDDIRKLPLAGTPPAAQSQPGADQSGAEGQEDSQGSQPGADQAGQGSQPGADQGSQPGADQAGQGSQPGADQGSQPGADQADAQGQEGAQDGQAPAAAAKPDVVRLDDVAKVDLDTEDQTSITRMNGEKALSLSITAVEDADVVSVSHDVHDALDEISDEYSDVDLTTVFDQAPFIEESIQHLAIEGLLGMVFAIAVILVFLLSARSTIVTAISIPLSVLVTFIGLGLGGYSLNMLTLGALTIAIGRVVDDSIVVIENIKRHLSYGEEKSKAILTAVKEVAGAITSATLTTVAVFIPIALVGDMVGELFAPFALTVTIAMISSLFVALTIVPVLSYWFLRAPKNVEESPEEIRAAAEEKEHRSLLQRAYKPILRGTQRHPVLTLIASGVLLVITVGIIPMLKIDFLGDTGQNMVMVTQEHSAGTDLDTISEDAKKVESKLEDVDGVEDVMLMAGSDGEISAMLGGSGGTATFIVNTDPDADQVALQNEIRDRLDEIKGAGDVSLADQSEMSGFGGTVDVQVNADDEKTLAKAADDVLDELQATPHSVDVTSDSADEQSIVELNVDRKKALEEGLTEVAVLGYVSNILSPQSAGQVTMDSEDYSIYVDAEEVPDTLADLKDLKLPSATGELPLTDIAEVKKSTVPTTIGRHDGDLVTTISVTPAEGELGAVTEAVQDRLDGMDLPSGATAKVGGLAQQQTDSFQQLGLAMVIAVAIVFMLLVATFRSLLQPLILLVSIPFAATGAILLLLITGTPLGISALIGMLMLIGIVVTNAIVLIDLVNQYRKQGQSVEEAVFNGARQRLRPILMTALATIFALLPMAFGVTGSSGFISQDLAIVVIGGLISSTALTLILVPVLYRLFEKRRDERRRRAEGEHVGTAGDGHRVLSRH